MLDRMMDERFARCTGPTSSRGRTPADAVPILVIHEPFARSTDPTSS